MKGLQTLLVLAALGVVASAQPKSETAVEQRFFNIEDAVQHRVELSDAELSVLSGDKLMKEELDQEPASPRLTQEGLEAAEVHLCGSGERDLVVIGYGSHFSGANVGDLPSGPMVVLSEISLGLTIYTKRSNKCFNLEAIASTAVDVTTTEFRFNGEKYTIFRQKSEKLAQ